MKESRAEHTQSIEAFGPNDLLIVFIGASAVGKSTVARHLCETGIAVGTPTTTDRLPRKGEVASDYDHRFVSPATFNDEEAAGNFMAVHKLYGARYGMSFPRKPGPQQVAIMVLKPIFIPALLEHIPTARIYQIEAPKNIVEARMHARFQAETDITTRLAVHDAESTEALQYSHAIFNNTGSKRQLFAHIQEQIQIDKNALAAADS